MTTATLEASSATVEPGVRPLLDDLILARLLVAAKAENLAQVGVVVDDQDISRLCHVLRISQAPFPRAIIVSLRAPREPAANS